MAVGARAVSSLVLSWRGWIGRRPTYVSRGGLSHAELPELTPRPSGGVSRTSSEKLGQPKNFPRGASKERKVDFFPGPWLRLGSRISDRQMRVWSVVGGEAALHGAWRRLPGRTTTVARHDMVRQVALGAGAAGVSLVGVEPWSPHMTDAE